MIDGLDDRNGKRLFLMQRVRIGLTGLAFVFLVVLLAMALVGEPLGEEPITANMLELQRSGQAAAADQEEQAEPAEPLAELGVTPGKSEANSVSGKNGHSASAN